MTSVGGKGGGCMGTWVGQTDVDLHKHGCLFWHGLVTSFVSLLYASTFWRLNHVHFSGPMMALCLAREEVGEKWREILGPKELEVAKQEAPAR